VALAPDFVDLSTSTEGITASPRGIEYAGSLDTDQALAIAKATAPTGPPQRCGIRVHPTMIGRSRWPCPASSTASPEGDPWYLMFYGRGGAMPTRPRFCRRRRDRRRIAHGIPSLPLELPSSADRDALTPIEAIRCCITCASPRQARRVSARGILGEHDISIAT